MDLSVIIVNYNVKHFLEQCLHSVQKAIRNIDAEIFVVDNHSVDGSAQLITSKFPDIHFIHNHQNVGFAKANNQAIKLAKGRYILLLNPDTVVEESTFDKVLRFMDAHPEAGGLGVKMIDGKGNFLPESKRGLPTPWVAFYKMFGLSRLFPRSKRFGKYHLSYLNPDQIHEVDVLAGAFMLLRKEALNKVGLLDEAFFMYGEDIDLSYRLQLGGYKNYYFPETKIIHYKGESTKKGSLNYVKVFYYAMVIFARKHFPGHKTGAFALLIQLAIYFRALLSMLKRIFSRIYLPVLDALMILLCFVGATTFWENFKFADPNYYPDQLIRIIEPIYVLFLLAGIASSGGYKKPINLYKLVRGLFWGFIALLLAYSLISEQYRFSRAIILLGSTASLTGIVLMRLAGNLLNLNDFKLASKRPRKVAIVGSPREAKRVKEILVNTQLNLQLEGFISINENEQGEHFLGPVSQLKEIVQINRLDEIIFCAADISSAQIMNAMLELADLDVDYKIAPPESVSIIGSNSIHTAGNLYVVSTNALSRPHNKRLKRLFDIFSALLLLLLSPIICRGMKNKTNFLKNLLAVLSGKKTLIAYCTVEGSYESLPLLKEGILSPCDIFEQPPSDPLKIARINLLYAKDYNLSTDTEILLKSLKKLDR